MPVRVRARRACEYVGTGTNTHMWGTDTNVSVSVQHIDTHIRMLILAVRARYLFRGKAERMKLVS